MQKYLALFVLLTFPAFAGVWVENQWRNKSVSTCFADGEDVDRDQEGYVFRARPWKKKHKRSVEKWVKEEYSQERTGIHFTGFRDCQDDPNADVIIFYNRNSKLATFILGGTHGVALVGPHPGSIFGYPAASAMVSISSSGMNKGTVIHEFGHSAGLHHEHLHYDAFKLDKDRCIWITARNSAFTTRLRYSAYDPRSVMHYCRFEEKGGKDAGLSSGDVSLLRELYP